MNHLKLKIALLVVLTMFCAGSVFAAIQNSKHDLSFGNTNWLPGSSYQTNEAQICVFCHTPHGGSLTGPLWNRDNPTSTWSFYSSSTTTAEVNSVAAVNDQSLLCLSCHDGTIAINSMLNYGSAGAGVFVIEQGPGPAEIMGSPGANPRTGGYAADPGASGHLEDDHPISFNYATAQSQDPSGLKAVIGGGGALQLFNGNVECSTCHDVHNTLEIQPFLAMDNTGSAMCLACHDK